jgi:hypothetical protein
VGGLYILSGRRCEVFMTYFNSEDGALCSSEMSGFPELQDTTTQKTVIVITTAVKISNPTLKQVICLYNVLLLDTLS